MKRQKFISFVLCFLLIMGIVPSKEIKAVYEKKDEYYAQKYEEEVIRLMVGVGSITEVNKPTKDEVNEMIKGVKEKISKNLGDVKFRRDFNESFNGFSLETERKNIAKIREIENVKFVNESRIFYPTMLNASELTQVLSLRKSKGLTGEGIVVSIIDTGIDTEHKDMRLSDPSKAKIKTIKSSDQTKYTSKVPYGYNFADNNDNVKDDEKAGKSMHGMHVAGIVAANGLDSEVDNLTAIKGVAPEAQLLAMKVFSNNPKVKGCYDDDVIAAIEDSVKNGADIINMSLGSPNGFSNDDDPVAKAIKNARVNGVLVLVAAGNEQINTTEDSSKQQLKNDLGMKDIAVLGSPGSSDDAFTVASCDNTKMTSTKFYWKTNDVENITHYTFIQGILDDSYIEVYDGKFGEDADFTDEATGKYALIERGKGIPFTTKIENALKKNVKGIIFYNTEEEKDKLVSPNLSNLDNKDIPVLTILRSEALRIKDAIALGKTYAKSSEEKLVISNTEDIRMSSFTSYGPTPELDFKPEITAPGGSIYSTVNNNSYENMNGTSMATPHVSGLSALLYSRARSLGLEKQDLADFVKVSLMNTSKILYDPLYNKELPYSPRRQGAGLAQVEDALSTNVTVTYGKEAAVALKSFTGDREFEITVKNYSNDTDYSFDLVCDKVLTQGMDSDNYLFEKSVDDAKVEFSQSSITVNKGSEVKVKVTLKLGSTLENFVEGFIMLNSKDKNQVDLHIPFMGFNGDFGLEQIIDNPAYDNQESVYANTSIVSKSAALSTYLVLGSSMTGELKSKDITFSPNKDGELDKIFIKLALLRNANDIIIDVVDKNDGSENVLRTLNTSQYRRRPQFEKFKILGDEVHSPEDLDSWDGYLYNKETGLYEIAKDGLYYIRAKARVNEDSNWQTTYMPVKVDTQKPTVNILETKENPDGTFTVKYEFKDENGIFLNLGAVLDGEEVMATEDGNICTAVFSKKPDVDAKGLFIVMGFDMGMNVLEFSQNLNGSRVDIFDYDASIVMGTPALVDKEGTILFNVSASKDIKKLKIGYSEAEAEEFVLDSQNRATKRFKLKEGKHEIFAYGYDSNDKLIIAGYEDEINKKNPYTEKFQALRYDSENPELELTSPIIVNNATISTDGNVIVQGKVKDNLTPNEKLNVSIMGNKVPVNPDGTFEKTVKVPLNRILKISVQDEFRNATTKDILVKYDDPNDEGLFSFDNLTSLTVLTKESTDVVNDTYTIKGYLTSSMGKLFINDVEVKLNQDNTFNHDIKVKQGINTVNVRFINTKGLVLSNFGYKVIYDTELPNFKLDNPVIHNEKIYTNSDSIKFNGTISDNTLGEILLINGNLINKYIEMGARGEADTFKTFEFIQNNVNDKDLMKIEIADAVGNFKIFDYEVVKDTVNPIVTIENVEDNGIYEGPVTPIIKVDEDVKSIETQLNQKDYNGEAIVESGEYILEVKATDYAGNIGYKTIKFTIDKKPVIETDNLKVKESEVVDFSKLIKVIDKEDGDISNKISVSSNYDLKKPGVYVIEVTVEDKNGNRVTKNIELTVMGLPKLIGISNHIINVGDKFDPLKGVRAEDFEDKDITNNIKLIGNVDTTKEGIYKITYSIEDKDLNVVTMDSYVTVKKREVNNGNDTKDPTSVILEDVDTGIKIFGNTSSLDNSWKIIVTYLKDKKYTGKKAYAYDITIVDSTGKKVQPRDMVKVSIPVMSDLDLNKVKVYLDDNNNLNLLDSYIENKCATFKTNHFSTYVVAVDLQSEESNNSKDGAINKDDSKVNDGSNSNNNSNVNKDLPYTGTETNYHLVVLGLCLLLVAKKTLKLNKK